MTLPEGVTTRFGGVHGVAVRPRRDEVECGDAWVVEPAEDSILVGVIDGLGHGAPAAAAARIAATTIRAAADEPVDRILRRCHSALLSSRGAAISLARIEPGRSLLVWEGVGNVEGVVQARSGPQSGKPPHTLVVRGGVVGYDLPPLRPSPVEFGPEHRLVLATDGIAPGFMAGLEAGLTPQAAAERILQRHGLDTDDALALVFQLEGGDSDPGR